MRILPEKVTLGCRVVPTCSPLSPHDPRLIFYRLLLLVLQGRSPIYTWSHLPYLLWVYLFSAKIRSCPLSHTRNAGQVTHLHVVTLTLPALGLLVLRENSKLSIVPYTKCRAGHPFTRGHTYLTCSGFTCSPRKFEAVHCPIHEMQGRSPIYTWSHLPYLLWVYLFSAKFESVQCPIHELRFLGKFRNC